MRFACFGCEFLYCGLTCDVCVCVCVFILSLDVDKCAAGTDNCDATSATTMVMTVVEL